MSGILLPTPPLKNRVSNQTRKHCTLLTVKFYFGTSAHLFVFSFISKVFYCQCRAPLGIINVVKFQQATNFYQNVSKSFQSLASLFEWRREILSKLKKNMPRLTLDQRVWVYIEYAQTNNRAVLRHWLNRWPNVLLLSKKTVVSFY